MARKRSSTRPWGRALTLGSILVLTSMIVFLISARSRSGSDRNPTPVPGRTGAAASAIDPVRQGDLALRERRLTTAERSFRAALQIDPNLAPARLRLIWILTLGMRRGEVLPEFEALAASRPLDFDTVLLWTQVRCEIWDPDKATEQLTECLNRDPQDRWGRLALAEGLRRMGKPEQAQVVLAELPDSDPEVLAILARMAIDRDDLATAEALLGLGPAHHADLAELEGRIALTRRDASAAADWFRKALSSRPDHRPSLLGLASALGILGRTEAIPPILEVVQKQDVLNNLARKAAESIQQSRRDGPLLRDLGAACEALKYRAEARAWYNLAITLDPLDARAQAACYRLARSAATPTASDAPP